MRSLPEVTLKARLDARERPPGFPIMHQDWRHLLFLHWKVPVEELQKTLPPGLFVDTYKNKGYVTLSPFFIENLSIAGIPYFPGISTFTEVNARTYVFDANGIPGIWFYSLDLDCFFGAKAAKHFFSLPYFFAEFESNKKNKQIMIKGQRANQTKTQMEFIYQAAEEETHVAKEDTLEFFLIERYIFFIFDSNQLKFGRVHHQPYPLMEATVSRWKNEIFALNFPDLSLNEPDLMHYSPGVDVDIFSLKPLSI